MSGKIVDINRSTADKYVAPDGGPPKPSEAQMQEMTLAGDQERQFAELGKLSPARYAQRRQEMADEMGIPLAWLDQEYKQRRRGASGDHGLQGHELALDGPEPWHEPVDAADLLDGLVTSARRYLMLSDGAAEILALWAVHAHCHDAGHHTPRLHITAPTKGCGKTTVLDWLQAVTPRSIRTESVTTAVLFRLTDAHRPVLLVDEVNRTLRENSELIAALNAGHRTGGQHLRCEGEGNTVRAFKTFAPVALAGIGKLPAPELADRSIPVVMRRATQAEAAGLKPYRADRTAHEHDLCRQAARWTADHFDDLARHEPDMPDGLFNRVADNWRPLFGIAELAGGHWPETARSIARTLTSTAMADDEAGIILLKDLHDLFETRGEDRLSSNEIVSALIGMEDRPWPEWRQGKPLTVRQLARLLEPFGISPGSVRTAAGTPKGYRLEQFRDAFTVYIQDISPSDPQHRHNPQETAANAGFQSATRDRHVADGNRPEPAETLTCGGVADENPPPTENEGYLDDEGCSDGYDHGDSADLVS